MAIHLQNKAYTHRFCGLSRNTMSTIYGYRLVGDEWKSLHLHQSFTTIEFFSCALPHQKTNANNKCSSNVANLLFRWCVTTTSGQKILCLPTCFKNQKKFHMKNKCPKWYLSLLPSFDPWHNNCLELLFLMLIICI